jgi:formylglycine-generating enzyme required for sulfatase activity
MAGPRALIALGVLGAASTSCELLFNTSHLDSETDASVPADGGPRHDASSGGDSSDHTGHDAAPGDALQKDAPCPGKAGPTMVHAGSYCIDSTEVTGADYMAFLQADAGTRLEPSQCAWKKGRYDNGGSWTLVNGLQGPAGNVDWCDAYVYCKWAGKRLCGDIGGGSVPYDAYADRAHDQWFAACSGPDAAVYPYGNTFDQDTCNGLLADGGYPGGASTYTVEPVMSRVACQGGYPGIFDMSGNAAEWEDCCDESEGGDPASQPCRYRGGSANSDQAHLECAAGMSFFNLYDRSASTDDLGFRCCAP